MDAENNTVNLDDQISLFEDETSQTTETNNEAENTDELRGAIEKTLSNVRRQSMLIGFQVAIKTVLDKIVAFERKPGSKSNNDHKRLIKDIKQFCETGLYHNVDMNDEEAPAENAEA